MWDVLFLWPAVTPSMEAVILHRLILQIVADKAKASKSKSECSF